MNCEYCNYSSEKDFVVCPHCTKTRKDITRLKNKAYFFYFAGISIFTLGIYDRGWGDFWNIFSFDKFISSFSGWGVLALLAIGIWFELRYRKKARMKWSDNYI